MPERTEDDLQDIHELRLLLETDRLVRTVELYADHVRALQFLTLGDSERQKVVLRGMRDMLRALEVKP